MGSDKVCEGLLMLHFLQISESHPQYSYKVYSHKERLICKQQRAKWRKRELTFVFLLYYLCLETVCYFAIHQQLDRIIAKIPDSAKLLLVVAFSVISLKKEHEKGHWFFLVSAQVSAVIVLFLPREVIRRFCRLLHSFSLPLWPNQSSAKSAFSIPVDWMC